MSWGVPSKRPLFSPQNCCALSMGSARYQGSCQSSEQGWKEGEKGSWGRCPGRTPSPSPSLPASRGSMAPFPAPGTGIRGACSSLARAAAFPALGWNFTCRLPAAGNSMLQESASIFLAQQSGLDKFKEEKNLLGTLKFKDTNLDQEMSWPQVARCWGQFAGKLWDSFAPAVPGACQ